MAEWDFLLTDYLPQGMDAATVEARLKWVGSPALLDMAMVARSMGIGGDDGQELDASISPRGMRILAKIPRLSLATSRTIVATWGSLQAILGATVEELFCKATTIGPKPWSAPRRPEPPSKSARVPSPTTGSIRRRCRSG